VFLSRTTSRSVRWNEYRSGLTTYGDEVFLSAETSDILPLVDAAATGVFNSSQSLTTLSMNLRYVGFSMTVLTFLTRQTCP
jgi:hypothetical protein